MRKVLEIVFEVRINGKLCAENCPHLESIYADRMGDDYFRCKLFDERLGIMPEDNIDNLNRSSSCLNAEFQ